MQVSVEKVSNIERRLTIIVPAAQVEAVYAKQIDEFAKRAKIKGFRPGKAPLAVIKQHYATEARQETLSEVIEKAFYQAISEQNLKPINAPKIEPKVSSFDQPLEFIASFEILPEIDGIKLALTQLEKLKVEVTAEDIERVVAQLGKQFTKWKVVERAAQKNDRVVVDYYAIVDGKSDVENKIKDFTLELGSKVMLPGFEDGLINAKAGEERTLNLTFPADFQMTEKAGKPIDFIVTVKQIFEAEAPNVDEDFVKKLGVKSGKQEDLQNQIRQSLEQERDRLVKEKLKEQIFSKLLEQNPLDVPKSLIEREAKNIHDEVYAQDHHHEHNHSHEEMTIFNDTAKKRVALGLLINEYAKKANINANKDSVQKRIMEIASLYENPPEVVTWLSSDERRAGIEAQVIEDQVLDKLMENVAVVEKPMSYAALKGINT